MHRDRDPGEETEPWDQRGTETGMCRPGDRRQDREPHGGEPRAGAAGGQKTGSEEGWREAQPRDPDRDPDRAAELRARRRV